MTFAQATPLVSVVLRTRNEARRVRRCLQGVQHQTYSAIEVIVVDNNSTDKTKAIALEYTQSVINAGPERAHQGNLGMLQIASGSYVMYLDADMILEPGLVNAAVRYLQSRSDHVGLYINETVLGRGLWFEARRFERRAYRGTCIDAVRFIRRSAVVDVGGFDEASFATPSAEDWDLDRRLSKIGHLAILEYQPESRETWNPGIYSYLASQLEHPPEENCGLFHDEVHLTPVVYVRKKTYYLPTLDNYVAKWGKSDPIVRRQVGPVYRMVRVFLEDRKWKESLRHPLLVLVIVLSRFAVGFLFVCKKISRKVKSATR